MADLKQPDFGSTDPNSLYVCLSRAVSYHADFHILRPFDAKKLRKAEGTALKEEQERQSVRQRNTLDHITNVSYMYRTESNELITIELTAVESLRMVGHVQ